MSQLLVPALDDVRQLGAQRNQSRELRVELEQLRARQASGFAAWRTARGARSEQARELAEREADFERCLNGAHAPYGLLRVLAKSARRSPRMREQAETFVVTNRVGAQAHGSCEVADAK